MAQSRIINYDGSSVTFWYQRHEDNKKIIESIPVFEFIQRLIIHIPDEQFKMLRYYGIYAKKSPHDDKLIKRVKQSIINFRKKLSKWRESIELSFGYDPIKCSCGNYMSFFNIYFKKDIAYSSA